MKNKRNSDYEKLKLVNVADKENREKNKHKIKSEKLRYEAADEIYE